MSKNTMTRDAMLFLPAKVIEGLLIIACLSLYSHIFTEGAVGDYGIINTTVQFAYLILAGWMANAATRYIGEEHNRDGGQSLFSTITTIYALLCAIVAVLCVITALITHQWAYYLGGALMFASYTVFQILNAALIQLGRMRASISLSLLSATLKLAVAYGLVSLSHTPDNAMPAILANTIADGIAGIGAILALGLPTLVRMRFFSKPLLQKFLKYGIPLMGVSISVALLNQIDKYLVTGIYGRDYFGIYSNNNSIASGIFTMISVGIMRGVYPNVLRAWRDGGQTAAKPLLDQGVRLYLLIAAPAVCGLSAISIPLCNLLFPASYEIGAPVICYTALAMFFYGLTEYANKAYELEQATTHVLQNSAMAAVIKIFASLLLLHFLNFTGGALGSVVAFLFYFIITCVRVRKRFLFRIAPKTLVRILGSAAICGIVAFMVSHLLHAGSVLRLLCGVLGGGLAYALCVVLSGECKHEFAYIVAKLKK